MILILGLSFLAGLIVADRLMTQDADAVAQLRAKGAKVGQAPWCPRRGMLMAATETPKAAPGDLVAALPHACWGRVLAVGPGPRGLTYVVGLATGPTVELLGRELAR